nr:efflux RND transporter periplasmic adaptor subunit [Izhakiella australiensis]
MMKNAFDRIFRRRTALALLLLSCTAFYAQADEIEKELSLPLAASTATGAEKQARGVLRAIDQAVLSSELNAKVLEMPFREGEAFQKGDLLVRFDCSAYQAQLAASQAAVRASQQELSQNRQLAELKSVGRNAVAVAEAHMAQAIAESQVYQIQTSRCRVTAPFSGQVVARKVQQSEYVPQGKPLLEIVNNQHLEINLLVPSKWLATLKPGQKFTFTPDETGVALQAEVVRPGALIDESSQTLSLTGRLLKPENGLLAGMSGSARFSGQP